jgi:hypothetical protein
MIKRNVSRDQVIDSTNCWPLLEDGGIGEGRGGQGREELVLSHFLFPLYPEPHPVAVEATGDKQELVVPPFLLPLRRAGEEEQQFYLCLNWEDKTQTFSILPLTFLLWTPCCYRAVGMIERNVSRDHDMQESYPTNCWPLLEDGGIGEGRGGQGREELVLSHFLFPLYPEPHPVAVEATGDKQELVVPPFLLPLKRAEKKNNSV